MAQIDPDVAENYRALKAERGLTWEQLAEQFAHGDRALAAWCREQATPVKPRGRSSAAKDVA